MISAVFLLGVSFALFLLIPEFHVSVHDNRLNLSDNLYGIAYPCLLWIETIKAGRHPTAPPIGNLFLFGLVAASFQG